MGSTGPSPPLFGSWAHSSFLCWEDISLLPLRPLLRTRFKSTVPSPEARHTHKSAQAHTRICFFYVPVLSCPFKSADFFGAFQTSRLCFTCVWPETLRSEPLWRCCSATLPSITPSALLPRTAPEWVTRLQVPPTSLDSHNQDSRKEGLFARLILGSFCLL